MGRGAENRVRSARDCWDISQDFPLAEMYAHTRILRIADGPDEVHRRSIAPLELKQAR